MSVIYVILVLSIDGVAMGKNKKAIRCATRSFIIKYGSDILRMLLTRFRKGESGESIVENFNVARMHILTWKNTFGTVTTKYTAFPKGFGDSPEMCQGCPEDVL